MIIAFTRLHYGKDYLASVIASAMPFVDKFVVLYTPVPTFGRNTDMPCPDSREALYNIAVSVAGNKLDWREGLPISAQVAMDLYPDADIALELDADEVIHPLLFEHILRSYQSGKLAERCYRLPFWHHWRSFKYVCEDSGWPARLYLPKNPKNGEASFYDDAPARVHHFGYARSSADTLYKWLTSAHGNEIRPEWWGEIWEKFPERLTDLHPVSRDYWNAQELAAHCLPDAIKYHNYAGKAVIE
jgi:hypothetical protein